jgi:hypothetical protein
MTGMQAAERRVAREEIDPSNRRRAPRRSTIVLAVIACAGLAIFIYSGIRSRTEAVKGLSEKVKFSAIPLVSVIHPKGGPGSKNRITCNAGISRRQFMLVRVAI